LDRQQEDRIDCNVCNVLGGIHVLIEDATLTDFNQLTSQQGTTLVEFSASWCGPCKQMKPILNSFSQKHPDINVVTVDVQEEKDLAVQYRIRSVPTLVVFRNGVKTDLHAGWADEKTLEKLVS
jgi:thioredoxin 1